MKQIVAVILFISVSLTLYGQGVPDWLDEDFRRMKYPDNVYFTGFAYGEVSAARSLQDATQQLKTEAQADLSRKIRVQITSLSQTATSSTSHNGRYSENETFTGRAAAESSAEIVGVKTESYYDAKTRLVYAFACVNRDELEGYYKSSLGMNLTQVEGLLQTVGSLEAGNEKAKARQQLEAVQSLFAKVRYAQDLLTAVDINATPDDLQQQKTEQLYNTFAQMQARLSQGVYVYVECRESNFSEQTSLVENKLKAELAKMGCSFVNDPLQSDFLLKIKATTHYNGDNRGISVCRADVSVSLTDTHKAKSIFQDEFSQKGLSTSRVRAGQKALEDAAPVIAQKISSWIY